MYKAVLLLLAATGFLCYSASLTSATHGNQSDYQALLSAERAFAAFTGKHGIKAGFTRYLAEEALVVVKGRYQLGKPIYEKMPEQATLLSWWPVYADLSASGDFGYTTGPFEVRPQAATDTPVGFGHFTSVWRKTSTGEWKVVADVGITHGAPVHEAASAPSVPAGIVKKPVAVVDSALSRKQLLVAEASMAQVAGTESLQAAYNRVLATTEEVRLYRTGSMPHIGLAAAAFANTQTERATYTTVRAVVAPSGDLGFTYGYSHYNQKSGPFLRIWKRGAKLSWQLVHEVVDLR
ncbi:nuclear transport factor 2 family protein [Hymenobacter tibetensis]|uniref:Nuclear transport factor 2 family protein n=1 Tax=Hymenobacter tibetensis TaxID=497967 RepID=A0ABY4D4K2_9BACT|nr:nuclear transport factor 2 family protein [Hymenobacter tibetensis]UOG76455.1 nuclear transport factor 2 family protein [Hymenobacter tibetensis]